MSAAPSIPSEARGFNSEAEFREVIERAFALMRDDAEMGPRLRAADTPQSFSFSDLGLTFGVRAGGLGELNLVWWWGERSDCKPKVTLIMSSEVANRYFQGRENVAIAVARGRIRAVGEAHAALTLLPLIRPLFARYVEMLRADYPHLVV